VFWLGVNCDRVEKSRWIITSILENVKILTSTLTCWKGYSHKTSQLGHVIILLKFYRTSYVILTKYFSPPLIPGQKLLPGFLMTPYKWHIVGKLLSSSFQKYIHFGICELRFDLQMIQRLFTVCSSSQRSGHRPSPWTGLYLWCLMCVSFWPSIWNVSFLENGVPRSDRNQIVNFYSWILAFYFYR
jgi:hypothetical protein